MIFFFFGNKPFPIKPYLKCDKKNKLFYDEPEMIQTRSKVLEKRKCEEEREESMGDCILDSLFSSRN